MRPTNTDHDDARKFKSPVQCRGIMAIKILVDEGPELRLRITGETHTSLHLLRSHLNARDDVDYANYFLGHPDLDPPEFHLRAAGKANALKILETVLEDLRKDLSDRPPLRGGRGAARRLKATGLVGYAVEGMGIGGIIKAVADFRVEEVTKPVAMDPKGRFTVARVTLTNWETNPGSCSESPRSSASTDRGSSSQGRRTSAPSPRRRSSSTHPSNPWRPSTSTMSRSRIRTHQKLGFGNHLGNRFTIVVRGCAHSDGTPMTEADALEEVASIKSRMDERFGAGRFPNRVGLQRFGSMRPVTATVGTHVLRGDWQTAVRTYIGLPGRDEETATSDFRAQFLESGVTQDLIEAIPPRLDFEAAMVRHLHTKPDDWFGAFRTLPNNLQLMMVHAVQSRVFNEVLARRLDSDTSVSEPGRSGTS